MGRRDGRSRLSADARRAAARLRKEASIHARAHAPRGGGRRDGQDPLRGARAPQAAERAARARVCEPRHVHDGGGVSLHRGWNRASGTTLPQGDMNMNKQALEAIEIETLALSTSAAV